MLSARKKKNPNKKYVRMSSKMSKASRAGKRKGGIFGSVDPKIVSELQLNMK